MVGDCSTRSPIGALTKSAIETENAAGIAAVVAVIRAIVTIATATREGLILSRSRRRTMS